MIMVKNQKFKVIEFDTGIVILQAVDSLAGRKDAAELIVADMPTIAEYLVRYHEYRAYGFDLRESHSKALSGAAIIASGVMDLPADLRTKQ